MSDSVALDAAVETSLRKIAASAAFRNAHRSRQFLEYVVRQRLGGHQDELKERTIGIHVFGRAPDFDTSSDAIVRVSANDVRKRLAQYYAESDEADPVRIALPAGSYRPEFGLTIQAPPTQVEAARSITRRTSGKTLLYGWAGAAMAGWGAFAYRFRSNAPSDSPLTHLWAPLLHVGKPVVISLPSTRTVAPRPPIPQPPTLAEWLALPPSDLRLFEDWHVSSPVLRGALMLAGAISKAGGEYLLRYGDGIPADEVRSHPIAAIGSFANPWTKQVARGLRFTFERGNKDQGSPRIVDTQNPARFWQLNSIFPDPQTTDYAIVTRSHSPLGPTSFLSLAGLHSFGNQVAGEFASSETLLAELTARAPRGWEYMQVQVVLEADVVGRSVGRPRILDAHFWQ